uniref:uncharacterized protein LOC131128792 n=1 Tax=Doryrhamphus excisus TaxID=161450 RepID=UPI0025AE3695|nr:uncharacterized protein LOC131128792 [Doryrhamphus excisus]XP_057928012.1 uncharacterized protein LOC131128792 [Doryrhamphus excisus]XP_057928013.1 uncharacterized protein LOC131128792 [Doryrhamphus excisus]
MILICAELFTCCPLSNSFTNKVFMDSLKETEIQSLTFFVKGKQIFDSSIHRSNFYTDYQSQEKCNYVKQDGLKSGPQIIVEGRCVFNFSFKIPDRVMPSSSCWVQYKLKATLKQLMKQERIVESGFIFLPKESMDSPLPMEPQHVHIPKKVWASGAVAMDVYTQRISYRPGETVRVTAEIKNKSSHSVKPTYILYWKPNWTVSGQRIRYMFPILEKKAKPVAAHSRKIVTKMITIPKGFPPSMSIRPELKNEYFLKVNLDMTGTNFKLQVKLPIFVQSDSVASQQQSLNAVDLGFRGYHNQKQDMSDGGQPKKKARSIGCPIDFKEIEKDMYLMDEYKPDYSEGFN